MKLNFSKIKVLLIGDFMVDHFIMGFSKRMSPEESTAPVVIEKLNYLTPGGAGNVALNLLSLGSKVDCVGIVGDDKNGKALKSILKKAGANINKLVSIKGYNTTTKKRIYSNGKQIVRIDYEENKKWNPNDLKIDYNKYNVILISDYNKGVVDNSWLMNLDKSKVLIDPKKKDINLYKNANIITPNLNELQDISGVKISNRKQIINICKGLIKKYNFNFIIAKQGKKGITIIGKNNFSKHINAINVNNPDVTGAGDTTIAALTLHYTVTGNIMEAANFANIAAGLSVSKKGTSIITIKEIYNYIQKNEKNN